MLIDSPDPKEVADFHFRQLRTFSVVKHEVEQLESLNVLASSSRYGLLFIGVDGGFKAVKLEDILILDEDRENRSIERNLPYTLVKCDGTPLLLAVNGSQTSLGICVKNALGVSLSLYSLSTFLDTGSTWQPFSSVSLSQSSSIDLQDFAWNPAIEGLFAFCLSDGSLHIWEVAGNTFKSIASLPAANVLSICWSPKGKQLVAGKRGGCFSQYKPILQEVKTVPPPNFEEGSISVTSICWISTSVFAVVYVVGNVPYLCIVSTSKDLSVVYTNYNDVCLGNCSNKTQKYFLHLEPVWGILICASLDSIEIAVLGDMPNWIQWDLKEDGKALLPGKDGATHPVGMTVLYSAQKKIIISENEEYPPMPVLFFLTNNGLLVSFHMINTKLGAASLVSPPLPVELKALAAESVMAVRDPMQRNKELLISQSSVASLLVPDRTQIVDQTSSLKNEKYPSSIRTTTIVKNAVSLYTSELKETSNSFGTEILLNKQHYVLPFEEKKIANSMDTVLVTQSEVQANTDYSYRMAIVSEIQSFAKELQVLKQLQNSVPIIDNEENIISLKAFALNLHSFQNDISQKMQSLSSDIHMLKNILLESFVMVEEAFSRERRKNDHSYITMLKERALDPVTARHMQLMHARYNYLKTQLQELSNRIDQQWITLMQGRKATRSNQSISSTEAIYKTIVNNQKIIHNLKKKVNALLQQAEEKKLRNITRSWKRSKPEDLSKLADEFLDMKFVSETVQFVQNSQSVSEQFEVRRQLSSESQNVLKSFLKESTVITVRPTAVYTPSQSRLLSNAILSEDNQEKDVLSKQTSIPSYARSDSAANQSVTAVEEVHSASLIYEPVTPPEYEKNIELQNKTLVFSASSPLVTSLSESLMQSSVVTDKNSADRQNNSVSTSPMTLFSEGLANPIVSSVSTIIPTPKTTTAVIASSASSGSVIRTKNNLFSPALPQTVSEYSLSKSSDSVANSNCIEKDPSLPTTVFSSVSEPIKTDSMQIKQVILSMPSSSSMSTFHNLDKFSTFSGSLVASTVPAIPIFSVATPVSTKQSSDIRIPFTVSPLSQKSLEEIKSTSAMENKAPISIDFNVAVNQNSTEASSSAESVVSTSQKLKNKLSAVNLTDNPILCIETASGIAETNVLTFSTNMMDNVTMSTTIITPTDDMKTVIDTSTVSTKPSLVLSPVTLGNVKTTQKDVKGATANVIPALISSETANSSSLASLFGQNAVICSPEAKKTESASVFEINSTLFGKTAISSESVPFFQTKTFQTTTAVSTTNSSQTQQTQVVLTKAQPIFETKQQPSIFSPPTTSASSGIGFLSQNPSFEEVTTTETAVTSSSSNFSFSNTPTFGQNMGSSFGLAKSYFGHSTTAVAAPASQSATSSSFSFGGSQNTGSSFGQGSFFDAGKSSEEFKNVFGTNNLFRNTAAVAPTFGTLSSGGNSFSSGTFSTGGSSVSQSRFSSFQQSQQPGTGFGVGPTFGGVPTFGASPTFGSSTSLSLVFGQQQVSSNFSSFANASSPTFGSLASQNSSFNTPTGGGFGSPPFGSTFGNQTSVFGSPSSPPSNSSAFTQWRN